MKHLQDIHWVHIIGHGTKKEGLWWSGKGVIWANETGVVDTRDSIPFLKGLFNDWLDTTHLEVVSFNICDSSWLAEFATAELCVLFSWAWSTNAEVNAERRLGEHFYDYYLNDQFKPYIAFGMAKTMVIAYERPIDPVFFDKVEQTRTAPLWKFENPNDPHYVATKG